jgi:branched-chain amino acid transport system substrate-binding protein
LNRKRFGETPKHHGYPYAFDAANLLFDAIESAAVQDSDGSVYIGRADLRAALYSTIDFDGVTGLLSCSEYGDCSAIGLAVFQLENPAAGLDGLLSNIVFTYEPPEEHE